MQFQVKGRNLEVSDSIRSYAEKKLGKLERQVTRYRTRGRDRRRRAARANGPVGQPPSAEQLEADIVKTKQFSLNAMSAEDAALQLELVGHDFFVFRNADSDEVNVVYRRRDGGYGLIEPQ